MVVLAACGPCYSWNCTSTAAQLSLLPNKYLARNNVIEVASSLKERQRKFLDGIDIALTSYLRFSGKSFAASMKIHSLLQISQRR